VVEIDEEVIISYFKVNGDEVPVITGSSGVHAVIENVIKAIIKRFFIFFYLM
jgi:hypothetical protein